MKSSRSLKLTLMIGAAATLTSCSEAPGRFESVTDCVAAGEPEGLCRAAYEAALSENANSALAYHSLDQCLSELDVALCYSVDRRGSDGSVQRVFLPFVTGFVLDRALSRQRQDEEHHSTPFIYSGTYYGGGALYRSQSQPDRYWSGQQLAPARDGSTARHAANAKTVTLSRGGFGGHAFFGGS